MVIGGLSNQKCYFGKSRIQIDNMFVLLFVIVSVLIFYVNFRRRRRDLYKLAKSLPNIGNLPILGHTHWFVGGPEKMLTNIKELMEQVENAGGVTQLWIGPSLYVVSTNPEDVQKILENCIEKDYTYKFLRAWLGNGLFVAPVDLWKIYRRILLPIFHTKNVDEYVEVFGQQSAVLVERLAERVDQPEFDVYKYITSCMLDIVFETAMGEKMDVQHNPDTPYLRARNCVMSVINMRLFKAWMQPDALFKLTPYAKMQKESIDLTHQFTNEVVEKKKSVANVGKPKEGRQDILELLISRDKNLSNRELREHIDSITIAGNDTTSLVIAYTLLLLGIHQDAQDRVFEELQSIFGDSDRMPTKEDMNKMDYLERVLKEAMRLYTVVPIIGRISQKETNIGSFTIPAGVGCAVVPLVMHRSKKLWGADADQFNPDRFLPENSVNRHPCAYIPFSHGIRNCIGRHFGMLAMKSILATVLRTYKIKSREIERFKIEILLFPIPGHMITLEKRELNMKN